MTPVPRPLRLGVNIDHVATVRNARGGAGPDPLRAARLAVAAGCDGITAHLREDRRHIRDADVAALKADLTVPLNLEMAVTSAMVEIALRTRPHAACLVPEKREERTTEGGLDVVGAIEAVRPAVQALGAAGIRVSLFIEPSAEAVRAAHDLGAPVVEFHTGQWCALAEAGDPAAAAGLERIRAAAELAPSLGIECHAGHGLTYETAEAIAALPVIVELNIGHFLIGEAVFDGLAATIAKMRAAMDRGRTERTL